MGSFFMTNGYVLNKDIENSIGINIKEQSDMGNSFLLLFEGIKIVLPIVSSPSEREVTSKRNRSCTFSFPSLLKITACIATPYAIA
jgi:hypothetical protein